MADVHLAVQDGPLGLSRLVVLKRIRAPLAVRAELRQTLFDEARVLARLSHPNLVQLLDVGDDADGPFLVVEYLPGETLLGVLRELAMRGVRLPWPAVCRIGADLAAALAAAHGQTGLDGGAAPILHRDLTPSNVILCWNGAVKLIDFGIAKDERERNTRIGTVKGKISYLAPELFAGGHADTRSDLWQLGVVLHEAASGCRLFEATDDAARVQAVLTRPIAPLRQVAGEVPFDLERLVRALLSRDPAQRPGSAELVRRELEETMRRGGAIMTAHELGDWLRQAVPARQAERARRELACLASALEPAPDTVVMPLPVTLRMPALGTRARRWKRVTLLASFCLLAAAIGSSAAAGGRGVEGSRGRGGEPIPNPDPNPIPNPIPIPDPNPIPIPENPRCVASQLSSSPSRSFHPSPAARSRVASWSLKSVRPRSGRR